MRYTNSRTLLFLLTFDGCDPHYPRAAIVDSQSGYVWMQSLQRCWCVLTSKAFSCSRDCKATPINGDVLLDVTLVPDTTAQPLHLASDKSFAFRLVVSGYSRCCLRHIINQTSCAARWPPQYAPARACQI